MKNKKNMPFKMKIDFSGKYTPKFTKSWRIVFTRTYYTMAHSLRTYLKLTKII